MGGGASMILSPVRGGTGTTRLAPPWSREQVQWLGRGFFVLRLAVDEASRWCVGAGFSWSDVYPTERIFKASAAEKAESIRVLQMNPWPVHVACDADPGDWSAYFSSLTRATAPVLDTGYMTLWRLSELPRLGELIG